MLHKVKVYRTVIETYYIETAEDLDEDMADTLINGPNSYMIEPVKSFEASYELEITPSNMDEFYVDQESQHACSPWMGTKQIIKA